MLEGHRTLRDGDLERLGLADVGDDGRCHVGLDEDAQRGAGAPGPTGKPKTNQTISSTVQTRKNTTE